MKKNLLFVLAGIFVALTLGAMILFVLSGDGGTPEAPAVSLSGTWKVVACTQAGSTSAPDREYFVFTEDSASAYRGGSDTPFVRAGYELAPASYPNWELKLSDISRKYTVTVVTDNYIRLYESSSVYMDLIRYANEDRTDLSFEDNAVLGTWNVVYRNTGETIAEEKIHFEDGILSDYRNGSTEPAASAPYYWNDSRHLCVDALGVEMVCYPYTNHILFFVEVGTGYVWELHAID